MEHESKFIEEVILKQRPDQGRAAGYRDVLARLLFESGDLLGDVVPYQGRVLPLEGLLESRRDHILPHAVHPRSDRVLLRVLLRPEGRPLLVEHAAHEHGVRGGHRRPIASPIWSLKYGKCHLSGDSTTPSSDTNSDATTFLIRTSSDSTFQQNIWQAKYPLVALLRIGELRRTPLLSTLVNCSKRPF